MKVNLGVLWATIISYFVYCSASVAACITTKQNGALTFTVVLLDKGFATNMCYVDCKLTEF